jgi:HAD superfamily hydrolase (TIGR01509 family)
MYMDVQHLDTLLFDFGGTLDAPGVHWLTRFHQLYPQVGLEVKPEHIKEAFYWADAQLLAHPEITTLQFLPLMLEHAALQLRYLDLPAHPYQQRLATGFCEAARRSLQVSVGVLTALRQRFTLGIISNFYGNVTTLCQECGLAALCDVIIDSAQVGISKPEQRIFTLALEQLGCAPHTAAYIGDSFERDVLGARAAGLGTIWLRGIEPRICPDPSMVDAIITTLEELPTILAAIPRPQGQRAP